ncbi:hypothetical protein [Bradyrhizobium sp. CCBAU 51753]|uniref:hypothetical protein n=1 Tax=Bradyrhizobium sp. CCBAU 51753 TaxID=1325100 RepID=UPI00188B8A47|nr:hypothetical protein [Bradyrhizobium sp. CCBAU 51753]
MTYWTRISCLPLAVVIGCTSTSANAEVTGLVCKVKSPQEDSPRIFEITIDPQERRVLGCFRAPSSQIVTQDFSEINIAAECPISEGGKRVFRLTRATGAITVSETLTQPIVSKRNLSGECQVGQIPPSIPAEAPRGRTEVPENEQTRIPSTPAPSSIPQFNAPPLDPPAPRALQRLSDGRVADIINEQFGRICRAKTEGWFSKTLRLDWTSETKIFHAMTVLAAIGESKEKIYEAGIRYLKFPNDAGGYNVIDWKTGDKSSTSENAPYYFPK